METDPTLIAFSGRPPLNISPLPIASYSADMTGNFAGPRFLSVADASAIGFLPNDFIQDHNLWVARIHKDDLLKLQKHFATVRRVGSSSIEYRWSCADGSERVFLDQAVLVKVGGDTSEEIRGTCIDITHKRSFEQQLQRLQKMDSFSQLARGIAHDFNNMLSVVMWNLDLLGRSVKSTDKDFDHIQTALGGALSCNDLLHDLLAFTRQTPLRTQVVDLRDTILLAQQRMAFLLGDAITIKIAMPETAQLVCLDPTQIEAALLTLAINGREAMPAGGILTIACADSNGAQSRDDVRQGDYVMLSVRDTGASKPQGGTNSTTENYATQGDFREDGAFGSKMVCSYIEQSGGHVLIKTSSDGENTIELYLPKVDLPMADAMASPIIEEALPRHNAPMVLVVEDNTDIREIVTRRIKGMGYCVLAADNSDSALAILRCGQKIDLLFTDIVMPGEKDGFALARDAIQLIPGIKVIFTSGYISADSQVGEPVRDFLQKPYRDQELLRALKSVLVDHEAGPQPEHEARSTHDQPGLARPEAALAYLGER